MKNLLADANATGGMLFGALLLIVAVRPRARREPNGRGNIPIFASRSPRGHRCDALGDREHGTRSFVPQLPRSAWMTASLVLLCGVGIASAVMVSASSSAYNTAVAANSPTIFYHLDETGAGTAADSSG